MTKTSPPSAGRPSEPADATFVAVEASRERHRTIRLGIIAAAVLLSMFPIWGIAESLSGETTVLDVTISIALSIVASITAAGAGLGMRHQKKRADRAEARERDLESRVRDLTTRLELSSGAPRRKSKTGGK